MNTARNVAARSSIDTRLTVSNGRVIGRRDFLRTFSTAALAGGALSWGDGLRLQAGEMRRQQTACILLWMSGGPSQFETFDPKPEHTNGGETKAISTSVPGLQISENLPHLAKVADRLAIIRSMTTREGEHQRASHLMHTAYLPMASIQYPSMGSVVAHEIADAACELPAYVRIGNRGDGSSAGFLGSQYDAFNVNPGSRAPENSRLATDADRFRTRLDLSQQLQAATPAGYAPKSADHGAFYRKASRMILSPQMQAFEIDREPAEVRDAYGISANAPQSNTRAGIGAQFATACLLARRLVESGVTFIEATLPQWDTHDDNFAKSRVLCGQLDKPFAYLLTDLEQRGLLERTLVIWMGEFGRSPRINARAGRDHFPRGFSAVLAGGGVRSAQALGATDAGGETVADRPVTEKDLFQTIYKVLRIDAHKEHMSPIGRPIKFVDGGQPVSELV